MTMCRKFPSSSSAGSHRMLTILAIWPPPGLSFISFELLIYNTKNGDQESIPEIGQRRERRLILAFVRLDLEHQVRHWHVLIGSVGRLTVRGVSTCANGQKNGQGPL